MSDLLAACEIASGASLASSLDCFAKRFLAAGWGRGAIGIAGAG